MEEIKENICRLCLKCGDDTFSDFSDPSSKEKLKTVLPELNANNPSDFVICSNCKKSLEESYRLTTAFSKNDNFIRTEKDYLKIVNKINLNRIVGTEDSKNTSRNICRICLQYNCDKYTSLNKASSDKFFKNILGTCLSKLDQDLTLNPVICKLCHNTLRDMFTFKSKCMSVERKVVQYSKTTSEQQIDLNKVVDFINGADANDSDVIIIDDEEDVKEDSIESNLQNADINKKRPMSEETYDVVPPKKQKAVNIDSDDNGQKATPTSSILSISAMPHFGFGHKLMYDAKNVAELKEWLSQVDTLKRENNWSDIMTIGKVLEKLKGMNEMYIWFNNISRIFSWEEWKKKLEQVFPDQNDYCTLLKKMVSRKKKPTETYVEYYNEKLDALKAMNITGENAVSCLIGGVSDIVTGCVARAGNYKTPEELLLYFKTCDEKKAVVESPQKVQNKIKKTRATRVQNTRPQNRRKTKCSSCKRFGHTAINCAKVLSLKLKILGPKICGEVESQHKGTKDEKYNKLEHNSVDQKQKNEKPRTNKTSEDFARDKVVSVVKPQEDIEAANANKNTFGTSPRESKINIISVVKIESPCNPTPIATQPKQDERTNVNRNTHPIHNKESNLTKDKPNATSGPESDVQNSGVSAAVISSAKPNSKGSNSNVPKAENKASDRIASVTTPQSRREVSSSNLPKAQHKESDRSVYAAKPQSRQEHSNNRDIRRSTSGNQSQERGKSDATHQPQRKTNADSPGDKTGTRAQTDNKSGAVESLQKRNRNNFNATVPSTAGQSQTEATNTRGGDRSGDKGASESQRQSKGSNFTAFAKPFSPSEENYLNKGASSARSWNEASYIAPSQVERGGGYNRGTSTIMLPDRRDNTYRGARDGLPEDRREHYVLNKGASDIRPQEQRETSYFNRSDVRPHLENERHNIKEKLSSFEPPQQKESSYNRGEISDRSRQQYRVDSVKSEDYSRRGTSNVRAEESEGNYIRRYLQATRSEEQFGRGVTNRSTFIGTSETSREESSKDRGMTRAGNTGVSSFLPEEVEEASYADRIRSQKLVEGRVTQREEGQKEKYLKSILKTRSPLLSEGGSDKTDSPSGVPQKEWESDYVDKSVGDVVKQLQDKDDNISKDAPSVSRPEQQELEGRYSNRGTSNLGLDELMDRSYYNIGEPAAKSREEGNLNLNRDSYLSARPSSDGSLNKVALTAASHESSEETNLNKTALAERAPSRSVGSYFNRSISSMRLVGSGLGSLFSLSLATRPFERNSSYTSSFATGARPLSQGSIEGGYLNRGEPSTRLTDYNKGPSASRYYGSNETTYTRRSTYGGRVGETTSNSYYNRDTSVAGHQEQSQRERCLRCYTVGHKTADCSRYRT